MSFKTLFILCIYQLQFVCVCLCVWLCLCMYVNMFVWGGMCVFLRVEARGQSLRSFSITFHLIFWDRASHGIWSFWFNWTGWSANPKDPPKSTSTGLGLLLCTTVLTFWCGLSLIKPQPACSSGKHFIYFANYPVLVTIFKKKLSLPSHSFFHFHFKI